MIELLAGPDSTPYADAKAQPQPRRRLLRTWLKMARPVRRFAARIPFDPARDAPDPAAAAQWGEQMIIEDIISVMHRDGTTTALRHIVTQLHGAENLAGWDEIVRTYDTDRELHRLVKAKLYFPDGTNRNAEQRKFVVPAPDGSHPRGGRTLVARYYPLRPGVIVELEELYDEFRTGDMGPAIANHFFLRTGPPCTHRRFTVAVAKPFQLDYRMHHSDAAPVERELGDYRVCTWEMRDAEAIEFDEWTPPMRDFAPWVDISTAGAWTPFARKLRDELEPWIEVGDDVVTLAKALAVDKSTSLEKASAAYTYVARTVRYGRPPTETLTRNSRAAAAMFQDLRGDCKDKSSLLVQLLRTMGMKAQIAAVMTADSGRTPFLPSARFNHAVVKLVLEDKVYWLDAANGPFAFAELPPTDQGIRAMVLDRDAFHFDLIAPAAAESPHESRQCSGRLADDGSYEFELKTQLSGEGGARLRFLLMDRTEDHRLEVLQTWLANDFPGAAGRDFSYESVDDLSRSFSYSCRARLEGVARSIKDLQLFRIPWSGTVSMAGPMSAAVRRQPLALPPSHHVLERHAIELPAGVTPYALPDSVQAACEWGAYSCRMTAEGPRLECERKLQLYGNVVPAERFGEFQQFWRQASWADAGEIVLREG